VEGRAREWCQEVRWRPRAVLTFYRGLGGGEAVIGVVTISIMAFKPSMVEEGL
jgi:hypothetical protein